MESTKSKELADAERVMAIKPDLERFYAKRMNAHTTEVKSSHVAFLSHPKDAAKVVEDAANGKA